MLWCSLPDVLTQTKVVFFLFHRGEFSAFAPTDKLYTGHPAIVGERTVDGGIRIIYDFLNQFFLEFGINILNAFQILP